ncbi:MAG: hypothetical protein HY262_06360 [Chloroflexi bacterium]|nr:hypothetical protein [Chloroflexota bacterium]
MSPLAPLIAGVVALAVGALLLRTYGTSYRVGRLLASTPVVEVAEARTLATAGPRYVAIEGRIDSETDFEDAAHRPLVFRRTRLQLRGPAGWTDLDDQRERVRFEIRGGLDSIAVDDAALDDGLVVVVRESEGTAADIADRVPAGTPPGTPARLRVEQVSSVEHAIVVGVPMLDATGAPTMSAGRGRPLILTTLERPEAMRILARGESRRPALALASLAGGLVLVSAGLAWALIGAIS